MTDVEHSVLTPLRPAKAPMHSRWLTTLVATLFVTLGVVVVAPTAGASDISNARAKAATLYKQINKMNAEVDSLGQRYDEAQIKLNKFNNTIKNTRNVVRQIKANVAKGNTQLRQDVVFAYVTNGQNESSNPLFTKNANKIGATNVYSELAEGNINSSIASLKNDRIELTQEKGILKAEDAHARAVARDAAKSFHKAKIIQATLHKTLGSVKGQIATYVDDAEQAADAASAGTLAAAGPVSGFPAPPPDSKANIAVDAALSFVGTPYVWGGASRSGVDCSGLIMLAYEAAGIDLPHYSGSQYDDTERVPLYDIEPGDLLFYGPGGDEHVAMYVGDGKMVEAEETGTLVHVVPIRLGYGFVGLGRVRA